MKLDILGTGWTFDGSTPTAYNDGRGSISVTLSAQVVNTPDNSLQRLDHDLVVYEDLVIEDGGVPLVIDTDYTLGDAAADYITQIIRDARGDQTLRVVNGFKIINAAFYSKDLDVTGIYAGDQLAGRDINGSEIVETGTQDFSIPIYASKVRVLYTRSATGRTCTIPDATKNKGQEIEIFVDGGAAGDLTLAGEVPAQTINGVVVGSWVFQGTGFLNLISDGANYRAVNEIWDEGTSGSDSWFKDVRKGLIQDVEFDFTFNDVNSLETGNTNFPLSFVNTSYKIVLEAFKVGSMSNIEAAEQRNTMAAQVITGNTVALAALRINNPAGNYDATETLTALTRIIGKWIA